MTIEPIHGILVKISSMDVSTKILSPCYWFSTEYIKNLYEIFLILFLYHEL